MLEQPLQCIVVTPEATVLDRQAEFVALPLYDGEIGIGRGHSPLIGRLGYGEMRLDSERATASATTSTAASSRWPATSSRC